MSGNITVGISDMAVSKAPDTVVTYALGSCVGICVYDKVTQVGGLSHILLPQSSGTITAKTCMKFADTAVPELIKRLEASGAAKVRMTAKIVGGAQMFQMSKDCAIGQIGQRNVEAVKVALRKVGVRIVAEDTGLDYGRTVFLELATGVVRVKTAFGVVKEI